MGHVNRAAHEIPVVASARKRSANSGRRTQNTGALYRDASVLEALFIRPGLISKAGYVVDTISCKVRMISLAIDILSSRVGLAYAAGDGGCRCFGPSGPA